MTIRKVGTTSGVTRVTTFADLTRADIVRQVRQLASHLKGIPTPGEIRRHFGLALGGEIDALFGSTDRLLTEAKLANRLYTDSDLLRHLSDFMGRSEKTPTSDDIDNDIAMPGAMHYIKRFGGIAEAIARANQNTPMPIRIPSPRRAPLPVVARQIEPAQMSVGEQPAPAPVRKVVRISDDVISLNKFVEALADRKSENVLLRHLWHRDRESLEGRELSRDLTLFVHLDPSGAFVDTMTVMKTSDWRNTWGRRLKEGETFHYTKASDTGEFNAADNDEKKATIQRLLGSGHFQAPDAAAAENVAKAVAKYAQPEGFTPLDAEMCKNEPLITLADLKKNAPLVNVPVELKTTSPGFAPTPLTPRYLATRPSETRLGSPLPVREGKNEGALIALEALMIGIVSFFAGTRLLRAPNLSPVMPSGSLSLSPTEDWNQSGT